MMQLLLDIGNSKIKWGLMDEYDTIFNIAAHSHREKTIAAIARRYWADISPTRVVAANVAGEEAAAQVRAWVEQAWQVPVEFLAPCGYAFGVVNGYFAPELLGADRWAALIAVAQHPHGDLCIVDCGTALTVDALSADNRHLGGMIVPGLGLMRKSLQTDTAMVRATQGANFQLLGGDTGSAVAAGTMYTLVALIERVRGDLEAELGAPITILLTGGDGAILAPLLSGPIDYQPNLVLQGLAVVAKSLPN